MKYLSILAGLLFLITSQQCKTSNPSNNMTATSANFSETTKVLQTTWLHSYEEDNEAGKTYRPNSYSFPPSRGRTGFAFEPGGKFIQYEIAPTDGLEGREGTWKMKDKKTVSISFPASRGMSNYDMEILSLDPSKLVVLVHER